MGPREPDTGAGFTPTAPRAGGEAVTTPPPVERRPGVRRGRFQSRRARLALALTGGLLVLLCVGGVGAFFVLYDEATEIKRTEPDAVVDSFLAAVFVNRDDNEASLYQCTSGGDFQQLMQFRDDTVKREKDFSVGIAVSWSSLEVNVAGTTGTVGADLKRTISGQAGRDSSSWQFAVVDQDGWRVCGATKTG